MPLLRTRCLARLAIAVAAAGACGGAKRDQSDVHAAPLSDQRAAKETEIDGLRLLDTAVQEPRLTALDLHLGYVESDTHPGGGRYLCGGMSNSESTSAASGIARALSRLPDTSLTRVGLRYVILCSRAEAAGRRIGGIPVPPLNLLMVDVGTGSANSDDSRLQHLFLHELYHLIEYRFNSFQDADWQSRFGAGYDNAYGNDAGQSTVGSGKRGFLNRYSESFPHEERAELFASLLLNPAEVAAHIDATNDSLLKDKASYVADKSARLIGLRITLPGT
jgi:hypothetical protein